MNTEIKIQNNLKNWDIKDVFEYLYHLRNNPSKQNNILEKIVSEYINKY